MKDSTEAIHYYGGDIVRALVSLFPDIGLNEQILNNFYGNVITWVFIYYPFHFFNNIVFMLRSMPRFFFSFFFYLLILLKISTGLVLLMILYVRRNLTLLQLIIGIKLLVAGLFLWLQYGIFTHLENDKL